MEFGLMSILLTVGAGLASVASPCVLPVLPIIVTGGPKEHRLRPLLIVLGLSTTFILMGVVMSAFGSLIGGRMRLVEQAVGVLILSFGLLTLLGINVFKRLELFSRLQVTSQGPWSGFLLGAALGLIWIPCVGPILSSILAMVATRGSIEAGVVLLAFYALGFSLPMLALGYLSQYSRERIRAVQRHPVLVRYLSGGILLAFGLYILFYGTVGFTF